MGDCYIVYNFSLNFFLKASHHNHGTTTKVDQTKSGKKSHPGSNKPHFDMF